jgi:hypothetical protein
MKMAILLDEGDQFFGVFSSYFNAAQGKKLLSQTTDTVVGDLRIKEIEVDELLKLKLRKWWVGTIVLATGQIQETLDGVELTDFEGYYTEHLSLNGIYIEVKDYVSLLHLRVTLKAVRDEYLRKTQNGNPNVPAEKLADGPGK